MWMPSAVDRCSGRWYEMRMNNRRWGLVLNHSRARRRERRGHRPKNRFSSPVFCSGRYFLCLFVFPLSSVCAGAVWGGGRAFGLLARGWGLRCGWGGVRSRPPPIGAYPPPPPPPPALELKKRGKAGGSSRNQLCTRRRSSHGRAADGRGRLQGRIKRQGHLR
jgi:hypothetical protein